MQPPQSPQPQQPAQQQPTWTQPPQPPRFPVYPYPAPVQRQRSGVFVTPLVMVLLVVAAVAMTCAGAVFGYAIGATPTSSSLARTQATTTAQAAQQQTAQAAQAPTTAAGGMQTVKATATPSHVVLHVLGNGDKTSASFTVKGTWQVGWTCDGGSLLIQFYDASTNDYALNLDSVDYDCASGGSSDTSIMHGSGTYYLSINGYQTWDITVTDLPN